MDIAGHAALVTGAGSGLGAATARALAGAGARVALLDLDAAAAAAVAADIGGLAAPCDVADAGMTEAAFAEAEAAHGPARILVNCAGIAPARKMSGRAGMMPLEDFRRVIDVNLTGTFNTLRLFAARAAGLAPLSTGERGVVINTASIAAYEGQIGQTAYAASKAGVIGLTLPAARELAPLGIRVCTIAPGIFETAIFAALPPSVQDGIGRAAPFPPRPGQPAEYARLVAAIIANPMLNGETIRLDGALRMAPQ